MAGVYSNSRLWLFENCPEYYKKKYIEKDLPDLPKSIEAFLGGLVHESLEWLYGENRFGLVELDDFVKNFAENWAEKFSSDLRINNGDAETYFNKGVKFLVDYYQKHAPFDENVIDLEKDIIFNLDTEGEYKIRGIIDKLIYKDGVFEVHDYKTNGNIKSQEEVDKDRQLAFYEMAVKSLFPEAKVKLIWHFLAFDEIVSSSRTAEELESLRLETLELIKKIENCKQWPACGRQFCDWCSYKNKIARKWRPERQSSLD